MKLYILRHGDAGERGDPKYPNDYDRPLSAKGIRRTEALARALRELDVTFDAILTSPLVRAKETAEIVERGLRLSGRLAFIEHLAPGGDFGRLVNEVNAIQPAPDSVLLVGHEPDLSSLISLLCAGDSGVSMTLKKGALCRMDVASLRAEQCASMEWLVPPGLIDEKN